MKVHSHLIAAPLAIVFAALSLPSASDSSELGRLVQAIRAADQPEVVRLAGIPGLLEHRDRNGNTPLIAAAFLGRAEALQALLQAGANPNATNLHGVTALLRCAAEPAKARMLLERGADPNIRSLLGQSPLMLAARSPDGSQSVRLLLEHGADPNATSVFGSTPLMAAASAASLESARLLVEHGADVNASPLMESPGGDAIFGGFRTPLMWAALRGDNRLVKYLLDNGAAANGVTGLGTALSQASWVGNTATVKLLLDHGGDLHLPEPMSGFTPLHWAASAEDGRAELVALLLTRGANPNAEGGGPVDAYLGEPQTPYLLAQRRGESAVLEALVKAGAKGVPQARPVLQTAARAASAEVDAGTMWSAMAAAVPPLQRTGVASHENFVRHASRQQCASCHQQYLPMAAVGLASSKNVPVDAEQRTALAGITLRFHRDSELDAQPLLHPEPAHNYGYVLMGLKAEGIREPETTDPLVHHLAAVQHVDGHWPLNLMRPPIQSSEVTATALGIFGLRHFGWPARESEFASRIALARAWLLKVEPRNHEEHVFRLMGLAWAGMSPGELQSYTAALLERQRADGGWSQLPGLESDAYATGQALYALNHAAGLRVADAACKRGLQFLLRTQLNDGTWHVKRRAFPFQPTMDSGFAHGRDGWISAAGTSWAVMALSLMLEATPDQLASFAIAPAGRPGMTAPPTARVAADTGLTTRPPASEKPVDFVHDIQPLLERSCVGCHSGEKARSNFRVTRREDLVAPGNLGAPALVPGSTRDSLLVKYVRGVISDMEMPPLGQREKFPGLTPVEVDQLSKWIEQGAAWPENVVLGRVTPAKGEAELTK
jgi:ankyrin repeat protein